MNKIQEEVLKAYTEFKLAISNDFNKQTDAMAVAAQLTIAYFTVAAIPPEVIKNVNAVINSTTKGGLNGY